MTPDSAAQGQATAPRSPRATRPATAMTPPKRNCTQRKASRSPRTLTTRFQPAWSTAAVRASTVAWTMGDVRAQGRSTSMTSGAGSAGSGPMAMAPSNAASAASSREGSSTWSASTA